MAERRICVITSGRADYGLLYWPMRAIAADPYLALQLIVTGGHLDPRFGSTVEQIEADGFPIGARVPILGDDDSPLAAAETSARAVRGVADALVRLQPDLVLLLGDRFEILGCAQAAMLCGVPVAHIGGGDITGGAFDDGIRHALTKLSHVHFATHDAAARRIMQMGEAPDRVHIVGNPGLDYLRQAPAIGRAQLETLLGAPLGERNLLVTFHPVTLAADQGMAELEALLSALGELPDKVSLWVTGCNPDPGHDAFSARMAAWADGRSNVHLRASLGPAYAPLMSVADAVVGNSSSGLTETPSVGTPTVDIGDRQAGRTAGETVVHAAAEPHAIREAIGKAFAMTCEGGTNPYGDGHSSERIVQVLRSLPDRQTLLRKPFQDLEVSRG
jgi:UDP-hydrolysing UDP-N-acetyl-D-glucosamine 2-epimerase